jgi:hypothetical protein
MSKRQILGPAVRAIRETKASLPATETHDPAQFKGSRFAVSCLMSHPHLCNIEAGRKPKTPIATIQRIADQLGVPIDAISYEVHVEYVSADDINATRSAAA